MTEDYQGLTPPPELVKQWVSLACEYEGNETWMDLATQAARWGADQELEACCGWIESKSELGVLSFTPELRAKYRCQVSDQLRAARRPKPPSLVEQALQALERMDQPRWMRSDEDQSTIRRALERLQELENNG